MISRHLQILSFLLLGLLSEGSHLASAEAEVEQWLSGITNSIPQPGSEAGVVEHLSAIRQAFILGGQRADRAWALAFNLGSQAAPLYPEIRRAFLAVPVEQRRYRSGDTIQLLGPLAGDLLPDLLPDPTNHGLTWQQTIPIAVDCSVMVAGLRAALMNTNPESVKDAALAVRWGAWSPAMNACVPELVSALNRWQELPPINRSSGILTFQGDPRDPDYQEDLRWATDRSTSDPWPALLVTLAILAPDHPVAITACLDNLSINSPAMRRRAALEALAHLAIDDTEAQRLASPWLGPGRRGTLALAVLTRHGGAPVEVLAGLSKESALAVANTLARQGASARRQRLPASWIKWLLEDGGENNSFNIQLLPWCEGGIEAALQMGGEVARWTALGILESIAPSPTTMPTGLLGYLSDDDPHRRELARAVLMIGVSAAWMMDLTPELIVRRDELAHSSVDLLLIAQAAEGNRYAVKWLEGRVAAADRNVISLASWWRDLLPVGMRGAIPPFPSTIKDTPGLLHRLKTHPSSIVSVDRHALAFLWHHGLPEACWAGLLARARGGRNYDNMLPLFLVRDPKHRTEGVAILRRTIAQSGSGAFSDLWYAGVRAAIPRKLVEPWFNAGTPQLRRIARELAEP